LQVQSNFKANQKQTRCKPKSNPKQHLLEVNTINLKYMSGEYMVPASSLLVLLSFHSRREAQSKSKATSTQIKSKLKVNLKQIQSNILCSRKEVQSKSKASPKLPQSKPKGKNLVATEKSKASLK
jgi:hypothetical protein